MSRSQLAPVVDVAVAEALDAVVLSTRDRANDLAVTARLKKILGANARFRRSAHGIHLSATQASRLESESDLDLRWSDMARRFVRNRSVARDRHPAQLGSLVQIKAGGPAVARSLIADSDGHDILDPHQIINVAAMTIEDGVGLCVFDEQGAGKTVSLIYAFDLLVARNLADLLLIVAPKSMVPEWKADFERFRGDLYDVTILAGTKREKGRLLCTGADVFITNFETAVTMESELRAVVRARGERAVLAIDESFFIKSPSAKRTRALRRLREWCGRAFVLCGTPTPNSAHDLVEQVTFVDFGQTFDGVEIPEERDAAVPVVQRAFEANGLHVRHLKRDVLPNLPPKAFQTAMVQLDGQQRRAYEGALRDLIVDLESINDEEFSRQITSFLARRSALLQICSNPIALVPGYSEVPAKLLALDALLSELIGRRREKVVVWSFYRASLDAIVARYGAYRPVRYDGEVTDLTARRDAVRRFQTDDETMLFVGNPAAAGAGLTLHRARFAIYESLSNQAAHYLQSLDRIHRRGQTKSVEYVILLADGTIEPLEFNRLTRKEHQARDLFRDRVDPPPTRIQFLREARDASKFFG